MGLYRFSLCLAEYFQSNFENTYKCIYYYLHMPVNTQIVTLKNVLLVYVELFLSPNEPYCKSCHLTVVPTSLAPFLHLLDILMKFYTSMFTCHSINFKGNFQMRNQRFISPFRFLPGNLERNCLDDTQKSFLRTFMAL